MLPDKTYHFLAGLPRSGSTVLAAILSQHPEVHASSTSGMLEVLFGTYTAWTKSTATQASTTGNDELLRTLRSVAAAKYAHVAKPVILDKSREWPAPATMRAATEIFGAKPKILATVRDVADCAASLVRVAKPNNVEEFLRTSGLIAHLRQSYQVLLQGYQFAPECIHFVEYDRLLAEPEHELRRIHEFLGLPDFAYDLENIEAEHLRERDAEVWQVPGLHDVRPRLGRRPTSPAEDVLEHMHYQFLQPRFWRPDPLATDLVHPLDLQLAAGLVGDFETGSRIADELAIREPKNNRAAFNRGWYAMRKGHLLDGFRLLDRGRVEGVFGNPPPHVPTAKWDGQDGCTVLLNLEGGFGDQIHGVRFARDLARRGNRVIAACAGPLALLLRRAAGVDMVVQHEAAFGVVHDYWLPSMTAGIPLGLQYRDIDGAAYLPRPDVARGKKLRIGLRWQGNPEFEHQQHRLFPPELLFSAVRGLDVEYVSLQRDEGAEHRPAWVAESNLQSWESTAEAVAACDLVVSSCTSVAHLAGAMGVPTWIVVPVLPYYLWAKPGTTTEWYDSVRLFRQKDYGDWTGVFSDLKKELHHAHQNGLLDPGSVGEGHRRLGLSAVG